MRLEQRLSLKADQRLTLKEALEQRLELAQKMGLSIESLRTESGDDPTALLDGVIQNLLVTVSQPELREGLQKLLEDPILRDELIKQCGALAVPTPKRVQDFALDYIYKTHQGHFQVEQELEPDKEQQVSDYSTTYGDFSQAFNNPQGATKHQADLERLIKGGETGEEIIGEHREITNAIRIVEAGRPEFESIAHLLSFTITKKGENGEPILGNFLRDSAVLTKLDFVLSERLQRRFSNNFSTVRQDSSPESFENAFLNTVGEYVLVSTGVVDPEIFSVQKGEIEKGMQKILREELAKMGLDLDKVVSHYQLTPEGTFFWSRWKTLERKPSRVTDGKIRDFITATVREQGGALLNAIGYEAFFSKVKEINAQEKGEERRVRLQDLLVETFSEERAKDFLLQMIREKWYKDLDIFYEHNDKDKK